VAVYARSDVMSVTLSSVHGGCGNVHSRPVKDGAPVRYWKLECGKCEDFLRSDPLWSSHESKIPETYDEQIRREEDERLSQVNAQISQERALDKISQALVGNQELMAHFMTFLASQSSPTAQKMAEEVSARAQVPARADAPSEKSDSSKSTSSGSSESETPRSVKTGTSATDEQETRRRPATRSTTKREDTA
jgi:hypothetical protein